MKRNLLNLTFTVLALSPLTLAALNIEYIGLASTITPAAIAAILQMNQDEIKKSRKYKGELTKEKL